MPTRRICQIAVLIGLFPFIRAEGSATWYVNASVTSSGDGSTWETAFNTIQEGMDAAADGDTVVVAQGTYVENTHFKGKNIVLRSTDPLDPGAVENTVIDGNEAGPVVAFDGTEDENCVLAGFRIQNGSAINGGGICGGTEEEHTRAAIRNNVITANEATGKWFDSRGGGAAFCDGLVEQNMVNGNTAEGYGGGFSDCHGTIRNNSIRGNSAEGSFAGGGGLAFCDGTVQNNIISENSATGSNSHGGGVLTCGGVVGNNLIIANSSTDGGGLSYCHGTVQNNTICGNSAARNGGGLHDCGGVIRNSIIWGNTADASGNQMHDCSTPSFCCIQDWTEGGWENTDANPQFVDEASGDYHLQGGSPCVDTGTGFYWFMWPQRDLDRNCRLAGSGVDRGCYEHGSSLDSDGDLLPDAEEVRRATDVHSEDTDGDGLRDGLEVLRGTDPLQITSPGVVQVPFDIPVMQAALCLALYGDEIRVAPGTYQAGLQFCGADVILRGWDAASTILVGESHPVISFMGTESETCLLSHFTIQNGHGEYGGGICGGTWDLHTRASIGNNVIVDNSASYGGAGIAHCDGIIENNRISRNSSGYYGGGLDDCDGTIQNNTIYGNSARYGGGLCSCSGTIRSNEVYGNSADTSGGGACGCDGTVMNNRIYGNSAGSGAGLYNCDGIIQNNRISGNLGSGLSGCNGIIQNCTICANSASKGGGLNKCRGVIRNCIIWGNGGAGGTQLVETTNPCYSCIQDWTGGGPGNVADDPLFANAGAGDYRLQAGSPCIDAGASYYWFAWPQHDLEGNCRLMGENVDMGCYEYGASLDSDGDLLSDEDEVGSETDPDCGDSDRDGLWDGLEVLRGSDPLALTAPRIVRVPSEVPMIQAALATAVEGDEIIVSPGIYYENLHFTGADAVLRSLDPNDQAVVAATVLDGSEAGPVVQFTGNEGEACFLSGFTILNGRAMDGGGIRGAVGGSVTLATIQDNVIRNNFASYRGGGIAFCDGVLRNNTVTTNKAHHGGGIGECNGIIENNMVSHNLATEDGGGLCNCTGRIRNNVIYKNSCRYSGGGLYSCGAAIENNNIIENRASESGGGLSRCEGTVEGNVIAGNGCGVSGQEGYGGGLYECDGTILNNTIVGNDAGGYRVVQVPEGEVWIYGSTGGIAGGLGIAQNCIIWGNTAETPPYQFSAPNAPLRCCIQGWTGGGEGNISDDPFFVDPDGADGDPQTYEDNDYRLLPDSPCIDAGLNEDWMWETVDQDGDPRIWHGTVDMGAFEYDSFSFRIVGIVARHDGEAALTWNSRLGDTYTVWSCFDLSASTWTEEATLPSQGETTSWVDTASAEGMKLYRIELK